MGNEMLDEGELRQFSEGYDRTREDRAGIVRYEFLRRFPKEDLEGITVDEYVIGHQADTFCAWVEAKSRAWANIQGATSFKFGIYFGKTKSNERKQYRFASKFGKSKAEAFKTVKRSLLKLVDDGRKKRFGAIEENLLSQMFKAKILSLYFPERYMNICSKEHLACIANALEMPIGMKAVEIQSALVETKNSNRVTRGWSNPKFSSYLYKTIIRDEDSRSGGATSIRIDFRRLQDKWAEIGRISEEYAIKWERDRLSGLGYRSLKSQIQDFREIPAKGFDYQSFSAPSVPRYIEVKSLGFDYVSKQPRFFLSSNEHRVSISMAHRDEYYFYLVKYSKDGKPEGVIVRRADQVYAAGKLQESGFKVLLDLEDPD